jgi:hypothetical protein
MKLRFFSLIIAVIMFVRESLERRVAGYIIVQCYFHDRCEPPHAAMSDVVIRFC